MGISSDYHITGNSQAFFGKKRMFYAHLTHFKVIGDIILSCKLAHALAVLCRLYILIRNKVVRHKSNLVLVEYSLL